MWTRGVEKPWPSPSKKSRGGDTNRGVTWPKGSRSARRQPTKPDLIKKGCSPVRKSSPKWSSRALRLIPKKCKIEDNLTRYYAEKLIEIAVEKCWSHHSWDVECIGEVFPLGYETISIYSNTVTRRKQHQTLDRALSMKGHINNKQISSHCYCRFSKYCYEDGISIYQLNKYELLLKVESNEIHSTKKICIL